MPVRRLRHVLISKGIDVAQSSDAEVVWRATQVVSTAMDVLDDVDSILERNPTPGLSPRIVRRPNDAETVRHIRLRMSQYRTSV